MAVSSEARRHLVRGQSCSGDVIKLSIQDRVMMGGADSSTEFGVFFDDAAEEGRLVTSLERTLKNFGLLAGRLVMRDGEVVIECSNAGLPLTFDTKDSAAPSRDVPYNLSFFDLARGAAPSADRSQVAGEALLRIRVTTFTDGQLLAVSFNHAIGDAASLNLFLIAWGEAYRGTHADVEVSHDRLGFFPETPAAPGDPPLAGETPSEQDWLLFHQTTPPAAMVTADEPPLWSVVSFFRTFDELAALKAKYSSASDGAALSSVDVLTAEIVRMCQFEADSLRLMFAKTFRCEFGSPNFFGNALASMALEIPNSMEAPGVLRKAVACCKSKAFIEWKLRQSWCGFELNGAHLFVNSWFRSVQPERIVFACPAESTGFALKTYEDEVGERARTSPMAHILPYRDGLRVNLFVRRSVAFALRDAGALQSCIDIDMQ